MAQLFYSGFETGSNNEWTATNTGGASIQSAVVASGSYAGRTNAMTSGTVSGWRYQYSGTDIDGPIYAGAWVQVAQRPTGTNRVFVFATTGFAGRVYLAYNSTGTVTLGDEDGVIGTSTDPLELDTPYYIEAMYDLTAAAGSHVVRGRIDGVEFASATNRNISSGLAYLRIGGNLAAEAHTQANWYWDWVAINDTTQTPDGRNMGWPRDDFRRPLNVGPLVRVGDGMSRNERAT